MISQHPSFACKMTWHEAAGKFSVSGTELWIWCLDPPSIFGDRTCKDLLTKYFGIVFEDYDRFGRGNFIWKPAFQVLWFLCQFSGVYCNIIVWICQPFVVCAIGIFLNSVRSISYPETPNTKSDRLLPLTMTGLLRGPGGSQGVRVTWTKCRLC